MTVHNEGKGKGSSTMENAFERAGVNQGADEAGTQRGGYTQPNQSNSPQRSIMNINSMFRRPISRSSAGESVTRYNETLRNILRVETQEIEGDPLRLLILDQNINMVALSSILVCYHQNRGGVEHIGVYTLIIESSGGGRLSNKTVNIAGQPVEINTVAGDVYDQFYWSKVQKKIHETYGSKAQVHDAGSFVIPSELDHSDEARLRNILFVATTALYTVIDNVLGDEEEKFNVGMVSNRDNMTARLDYGTANDESAAGLPVRSDVTITLQGVANAGNQTQYEQTMDVTKVDGFVDLVYDANSAQQQQAQSQNPWAGWQQQQQTPTQRYFPRFVISNVDTEINAVTMELQLLALSTSTLLSRGMSWAGVFHPNYNARQPDLRDIGAVGYEINLTGDPSAEPDRVDTKAESFSREYLYKLIHMSVHDALIYSMDVEETGELSWINGALGAAASGDAEARQVIVDAANNLTLGHFGRIFGNEAIAIDDYNRIHLGYYVDHDGNRRDLREMDYLGMLNMVGDKDMKTVIDFADTYDRADIPLEMRLERRSRILQSVLGDSMRIKGYARRITFNPAFIMALEEACARAGLVVRPGNIQQDFGTLGVRGNASASQYAVRGFQGSMFQSSQPNYGQHRQQPSFFGRWNR